MRRFTRSSLLAPCLAALLVGPGAACTTAVPMDEVGTSSSSTSKMGSSKPTGSQSSKPGAPSDASDSVGSPDPGEQTDGQPGEEPGEQPGEGPGEQPGGEPGEEPDQGECQDGEVDRNCHAREDGTPIEFPTGVPIGNCKAGTRVCADKQWGPCKGAIPPEPEDDCEIPNDDASCDGVANAGCDCVTGETRSCGKSDVGACKLGTQRCVDGQWEEACEGAINPSPEKCDGQGIDEDCDGDTDLADDQCACIDDSTEYCERSKEKGDCKWGQRSCKEGSWSSCKPWAKKQDEICGSRPAVKGIVWTGDEDCDGGVDTSPLGKPGPKGCIDMMLDQDKDGYGKFGPDLSKIKFQSQLDTIGTACLCPDRPDIKEKRDQGWIERNFKANRDCGDCPHPLDAAGREAFPGSRATTTVPNRCLRKVNWLLAPIHAKDPGYFDLNCDRVHKDPDNRNGELEKLVCRPSGEFTCTEVGNGRLILPKGQPRLLCGRRYDFGRCYPIIKETYQAPSGSLWQDDATGTGGDDTTTGDPKPKKKLVGCGFRKTGRRHLIRCH